MGRVQLEICCGWLDDAVEAGAGGADRVELCSALFLGGLTPSYGALVEAKKRLSIPVIFMARPRGGGFCYTATEMAAMERDTEMHPRAERGSAVVLHCGPSKRSNT